MDQAGSSEEATLSLCIALITSCHGVSPDHFQLCCELKSKEVSQSFKQAVTKKDNIKTHGGMSQASADGK